MANINKVLTQPAVFFELDNVVRRFKSGVAATYAERFGMVPPAPVDLGEQEVIPEVARFIARHCMATGAKPIGLDMAPYLGHKLPDGNPVVPIEAYKQILKELKALLDEYGVRDTKFLYCPHPAREVPHFGLDGKKHDSELVPTCACRFPNRQLLYKACKTHDITHWDPERRLTDASEFGILKPSIMIGNSPESREAAIVGSALEYFWVEGIINGSALLAEQVTNAHLKAAHELREAAPRIRQAVERDKIVEGVPNVGAYLPEALNIPSKITHTVRVVENVDADRP